VLSRPRPFAPTFFALRQHRVHNCARDHVIE
jgi:hypothetical protein